MTFAKSDAFTSRFGRPAHSRIALALSHAISDSHNRPQVVPFGSNEIKSSAAEDYFETLLGPKDSEVRKSWNDYTDTTKAAGFPQKLAKGTAPLNGFRHYTLQDAVYLDYYVRVRMAAIGTWDSKVSLADLKAFVAGIPSSLAYAEDTQRVCQDQLGVPETDIKAEQKSTQLHHSIEHYEDVIAKDTHDHADAWLDIYFALLPCIKGYYKIAKALSEDQATDKNTLYYSLWIVPNADPSYVNDYDDFITKNIAKIPDPLPWDRWRTIFQESCNNEKNFFDLGIKDYPKYNIVSPGIYKISPYGAPGFLSPDHQGGVTISEERTEWELVNYTDGYLIELDNHKYLGVDDQQKVVIRNDIHESTKWTINPVSIPGELTFQLFLPGVKQALKADGTKVSVAENDPATQRWILRKFLG